MRSPVDQEAPYGDEVHRQEYCIPPGWKQMLQDAVQQGIAQGLAFMMEASGGRMPTTSGMPQHLENSTSDDVNILEGDFNMSKKFKERVQVGNDACGKPIYKWAYGDTKQELQLSISHLLLEAGMLGTVVVPNAAKSKTPTVEAFIRETYMPTFMNKLAGKTKSNYMQYIELNIVPFMGHMRLDEVSVTTIQQFYDWMACAADRGRKKNLNQKSIERISGLASRIFRVAKEMKIIEDSPFKKTLLTINAEQASHHTALPDADVARIKREIPSLEKRDERIYMALLVFTGLRPEEVRGLRWQDVFLDQQYGMIQVAVTYPENNHPVIGRPKTERSSRTVLFPSTVVDILRPHQQDSGYICGGENPWCYSKARRVSKGAFKALGIVGYTDYDFRSTFGTQLKESGKTSAEVADLMGHADTRMVETVYARTRHEGVMKHLKFIEELNTRVS